MFCPKCTCEFPEWLRKCPDCSIPLVETPPPARRTADKSSSYEALVDLVKDNGGELRIDVSATEVGRHKRWSFPGLGWGFAWPKRMQGILDGASVDLRTAEVAMEKKWGFPGFGWGFAWAKRMRGSIGGNDVFLKAEKVARYRKWFFLFKIGWGYAWAEEMSGECGDQLKAKLVTTDVGKDREYTFPGIGWGCSWANKGVLTLTLKE